MVISTSTLVITSVGRLSQRGIDPWSMGAVLRFRTCFWKEKEKNNQRPSFVYNNAGLLVFFFFPLQFCDIKKLANFSTNSKISWINTREKKFPKIPQDFVQKTTKFVRKIHCNHCGSQKFENNHFYSTSGSEVFCTVVRWQLQNMLVE